MLALLFALQLAVTPVPIAAEAVPAPVQAAQGSQAPQVTAEVPWTSLGPFSGVMMAFIVTLRLLDKRAARRARSDPPPAPMPGGLPTVACQTLHEEILRLGPRLEALTSASERNVQAVGALTTRMDRYISYQEGLETGRTGQHRKVGT